MHARDCGSSEYRNPAAHEVRDDAGRRRRRRRKSHGLRIRGCRKSRGCLRAFDCSSSSNRSRGFDLRYGGYGQRKAAITRVCSVIPPLQTEAEASVWETGKGDGKHCRSTDNHPEKQTTIAKQIQSRQADVPHPLVLRRVSAPFASAPAAPGVQGDAPAALFPRFLSRERNRAAGGNPRRDPRRSDHCRENRRMPFSPAPGSGWGPGRRLRENRSPSPCCRKTGTASGRAHGLHPPPSR